MEIKKPHSTRRRVRRILVGAGVFILVVAVLVSGAGVWTVTRSFPQYDGRVHLAGLSEDVSVYRDDAGIPQVVATNPEDLFRAQGYVQAQDRFWEMDFRRHVTAGRLAELFGESQVGTDAFIRTLGWRTIAEEEVRMLDEQTLSYYQAYADGVNDYLAAHSGADLSLEYVVLGFQNADYSPEPWTPADSVAWLKAMAWDLRSNLVDEVDRALLSTVLDPEEVAQLHPDYPYGVHPTIVTDPASDAAVASVGDPAPIVPSAGSAIDSEGAIESEGATAGLRAAAHALRWSLSQVPELLGPAGGEIGSNSWVIDGSLSDTGKPLLANDPHLGPAMPSVWHQIGLRCAEVTEACPFDVAGYSFSGLPGIVIGHNAQIGWGFTNLGPDVADLYLERVTGDDYEFDGEMKPLQVRTETIRVADGDDVSLTIRATEHGPLMSDLAGEFASLAEDYPDAVQLPDPGEARYALSLQWTALTPGTTGSAIFAMNTATDWDEFRDAAQLFDVPSQNLLYADREGNIGYQAPGTIPIRAKGDGTLPNPGWTSEFGWTSFIPFDELPSVLNPESGYIVTANNAAVGPEYPYLITRDWDLGYRAQQIETRLKQLIQAGEPITAEQVGAIQGDNHLAIAQTLVPALKAVTVDDRVAEAVALFDDWDFAVDSDSAAAAYFSVVWRNLLVSMFDDTLPDGTRMTGGDRSFAVVAALLDEPDSRWWTNSALGIDGRDAMLAHALGAAQLEAERLMGGNLDRWRWDRIHTLTLTNQSFGKSGIAPIEWLFNRGPYGVGGASAVVNAVGWDATQGYEVNWVPSMRQVLDLNDWDDSTWINLTGSSGHAFHPNYADQTPLWQKHETRPWLHTLDRITFTSPHTLVLAAEEE